MAKLESDHLYSFDHLERLEADRAACYTLLWYIENEAEIDMQKVEELKQIIEYSKENVSLCEEQLIVLMIDMERLLKYNNLEQCITNFVIPNGVTSINFEEFSGFALVSISIPNSVTSIGSWAFSECYSLTTITFEGTIEEWNAIAFGYSWNEDTGNYVVYCTDGNICKAHTVVIDEAVPPTCTETGLTEGKHCSVCGEIIVAQTAIDALGHTVVVDEAVEPTCTETGLTEGKHCSVCGEILVAQEVVGVTENHDYKYTVKEADTTQVVLVGSCSVCGDTVNETVTPVDFTVTSSNRSMIGYTGEEGENLVIPAVFEDNGTWYKVTTIGERAFYNCINLMSVTIPDSVTIIGKEAFRSCEYLISITIGNSVTTIGDSAFSFCDRVVEVINKSSLTILGSTGEYSYNVINAMEVHSGTTKIVNQNDYLFYTYNNGVNSLIGYVGTDTELTLPANYNGKNYKIDRYAFYKCIDITSITIPDSVTSIGQCAFNGCESLTNITIPNSVTNVGSYAFEKCLNLQYTTYDNGYYLGNSENPYLVFVMPQSKSITSCQIYDTTKILCAYSFSGCSSLTSITIPDSVTSIGSSAFYNCTGLTNVTIGNSVISIGSDAFEYCQGLASITIPSSITSIGSSAFYRCTGLTSVHITDIAKWCEISFDDSDANPLYYAKNLYLNGNLVTDLIIPEGVTSIGSSAFYNCTGLTSITIPSSVTNIGNYTFYNCSNLMSITIPNSVITIGNSAFANCKNLTNVTMGNSITNIGNYAFDSCSNLTSITIPDSVTTIGSYAFSKCSNLTSVTVGNGVKTIGTRAFFVCYKLNNVYITDIEKWCDISFSEDESNPLCHAENLYLNGNLVTELVIPEGVTSIGDYAFNGCRLTKVTIPSSVTSIGTGVFAECSDLTSIVVNSNNAVYSSSGNCLIEIACKKLIAGCKYSYIPTNGSVTSIADHAFYGCNYLTSITIPESVTSIGNEAFAWCRNLTRVTLKNGLTSIGDYAFNYCDKLSSITIPNSVTSIGVGAFRGCYAITSIKIPFGVTSIGNYAFESCKGLTSITLPSSVTSIGVSAFNGCTSLASITIPSSATSIGSSAFSGCSNLTSIDLGNGVTNIGSSAFSGCTNLTSITIPASVTSIGSSVFSGCTNLKSITFDDTSTWYRITTITYWESMQYGTTTSVTNSSTNATYFKSTYNSYYWYKK